MSTAFAFLHMLLLCEHARMNSDTRTQRLRQLISAEKTTAAFARKYGLDPNYLSQMLTGHRNIGEKTARKIETATGKPIGWLDGNRSDDQNTNTEPLPSVSGSVPLISWVQAGDWCEAHDPYPVGDAEEWLPAMQGHSKNTYALRVKGDSMTSPVAGQRSYPEGVIIYVDPDAEVLAGKPVIAKLPDSNEATFKMYVEDAGIAYLKPLNPQYQMLPVPVGTVFCGVVRGSYWPE